RRRHLRRARRRDPRLRPHGGAGDLDRMSRSSVAVVTPGGNGRDGTSSLPTGTPGWDGGDVRVDGQVPLATALLTAGLCAEIFSGNWGNFGVPGALDRVLVAAGFAAVVIAGVRLVSGRRFHARPIHVLLVVASVYALCSAVAAGTISDSKARFALLDRFGF